MFLGLILGSFWLAGCSGDTQAALASATRQAPAATSAGQGFMVVSQQGKLVRVDRNGQNPFALTGGFSDQHPAYRPNGSDIIFSRQSANQTGKADIYRIRPDGSGLTDLTASFPFDALDPHYAWDGSKIVFSAQVGPANQDIYIMNADGTGIMGVTSGPAVDTHPALSPDGNAVVFERGSRICKVASTGGSVTNLTDGTQLDSFPSYCPPGDVVVFSRKGDLWMIDNQVVSQVTNTPKAAEFHARHSQEHDKIFALAGSNLEPGTLARQEGAQPTGDIVVMNTDGGDYQLLTTQLQAQALAVGPLTSSAPGNTVPMNLTNNSQQILYVYIFGYDPTKNGTPSYLSQDHTVQPYVSGPGVPPVVATIPANGGTASVNLPLLTKARVYFSTNNALTFTAFEESPGLSDGSQLYDFIEYDYSTAGGTFTADTSCVEAFALPFKIESTPPGTANGVATPVGIDAGGRTKIFAAMVALGTPWSNLIVSDGTKPTRLLAPWHGDMATPPFPSTYLDPSISLQWGQPLKLNTYLTNPPSYYVAKTATAAGWIFKPDSGTGATVTYTQVPSSKTAFSCDIPYQSTDVGLGQRITAMLAAGLNRGTLLFPNDPPAPIPFTPVTAGQPDFSPVDFYLTSGPKAKVAQVNQYANILHQFSIQNYQYGFASDDQGSQSSTLTCPSIQSLSVTVSSF